MTGRTLGHYELLDEIGRGGMGVVFRLCGVPEKDKAAG
ncbi:MAG: hypothetical protein JWO48_2913 [Bryobacterales bacterium]|nr:hypothetical protein [Bryobacterales bacterium]